MKKIHLVWIAGFAVTLLVIVVPLAYFLPKASARSDHPASYLPSHPTHTSHADIIQGPFATGQEVTRACLECHPDASKQVMATTHWTWESQPVQLPGRDAPVTIGKKNQINNFCIGIQGNQRKCTTCHAGYGWEDASYDFNNPENVDCLACHADLSVYAKGEYGYPAEGVDLAAAAKSVRSPTRENCGACHFLGGGGNGVKHGDLDESLYFPSENLDVHMGGAVIETFDGSGNPVKGGFQCTDCHWTKDHQILGRLVVDNPRVNPQEQVACTNCHAEAPHEEERLNAHTQAVACQTCHIPAMALKDPTKTFWDWSTAGQDLPDDHFTYLKIKGSFVYQKNFTPTYLWFNGNLEYRYLLGDPIDPAKPTLINLPAGSIRDANARIFPFKLHIAKQPYDVGNNYLLQPITAGEGGYWSEFDWDKAFRLAESITGLEYSGQYGFTETWMYWPTTHMVQSKENALQCIDCHSADGRLDWIALGYPGDPMEWGGR